jgi:hypothetical protein
MPSGFAQAELKGGAVLVRLIGMLSELSFFHCHPCYLSTKALGEAAPVVSPNLTGR